MPSLKKNPQGASEILRSQEWDRQPNKIMRLATAVQDTEWLSGCPGSRAAENTMQVMALLLRHERLGHH